MALRILMATFGFLELYPEETPDILNRTMMCAFLCASICFEIARREETTEGQLQHYLFTRNYVEHYRKRLAMAGENTDARERFVKLIVYDFESAAKLKNWDALEKLVDEAKDVPSSDTVEVFGKMGDLVGCAMAPERIVKMVWKRIVDHQMTLQEQVGLRTMSAWIRMVVQFSLKRDPDDVEEAFGQALELTRGAREDSPYPDEELQWLTGEGFFLGLCCNWTILTVSV